MTPEQFDILIKRLDRITMNVGYKDYMTYTEAVEYLGKSHTYFKSKIKEWHVVATPTGFYSKEDLDMIKLGRLPRIDKSKTL